MKLYTEEQVVNALNRVFIESITIEDVNEVMRSLTPIELPSELTALNKHLKWLKKELQRVIDDGESESWFYAYKRAIKNAESLIDKYENEQQ